MEDVVHAVDGDRRSLAGEIEDALDAQKMLAARLPQLGRASAYTVIQSSGPSKVRQKAAMSRSCAPSHAR